MNFDEIVIGNKFYTIENSSTYIFPSKKNIKHFLSLEIPDNFPYLLNEKNADEFKTIYSKNCNCNVDVLFKKEYFIIVEKIQLNLLRFIVKILGKDKIGWIYFVNEYDINSLKEIKEDGI